MRDFGERRGQKQGIISEKSKRDRERKLKGGEERIEQEGEKGEKSKRENIGKGAGVAYRRRETAAGLWERRSLERLRMGNNKVII